MSKTIYTNAQIKVLLANPNVERCSAKSITYSKKFKLEAVKEYYEHGLGPNAIFKKAGFDLGLLGLEKPKRCLKQWRKVYKTKGQKALLAENRGRGGGRKPKPQKSDDQEYLKARVAYLESENDFLRKLKTKTKI